MLTAQEVKTLIETERNALETNNAVAARVYFLIVEEKLPELTKKLDGMIRRASKIGVAPISYTVGSDHLDETYTRELDDGSKRNYVVRYKVLHIQGETPKLNGWVFAATIQHLDGGENIIRNITDMVAPVQYRTAPSRCDHCKTSRRRIDTHLVYHSATGVWKQVGANCIADFLGGVEATRLARQAEYFWEALAAAGEGEEGFGYGGSMKPRYSVLEVLTLSAGAIEQFGWLSRSKARELNGEYSRY